MREQKLSNAPAFRPALLSTSMLLLLGQIAFYTWIPTEFCNYLAYDLGGNPQSAQLVERGAPTGKQRKQVVRHVTH